MVTSSRSRRTASSRASRRNSSRSENLRQQQEQEEQSSLSFREKLEAEFDTLGKAANVINNAMKQGSSYDAISEMAFSYKDPAVREKMSSIVASSTDLTSLSLTLKDVRKTVSTLDKLRNEPDTTIESTSFSRLMELSNSGNRVSSTLTETFESHISSNSGRNSGYTGKAAPSLDTLSSLVGDKIADSHDYRFSHEQGGSSTHASESVSMGQGSGRNSGYKGQAAPSLDTLSSLVGDKIANSHDYRFSHEQANTSTNSALTRENSSEASATKVHDISTTAGMSQSNHSNFQNPFGQRDQNLEAIQSSGGFSSSHSASESRSVSDTGSIDRAGIAESQSVTSGEALRVGPQDGRDVDWSAEQKSVSMQRPEDLIGVGSSLAQGGRASEGSSSSQSHSHSVSDSASQSVKSGEALRVGPQDGRDVDWSAEQKSVSMQRPEDLIGVGSSLAQGGRVSEGSSSSQSHSQSISDSASQSVKSGEALRVGPQDGRDVDWSAEQKSVSMQRPEDLIGVGSSLAQGGRVSEGSSSSQSHSQSISDSASQSVKSGEALRVGPQDGRDVDWSAEQKSVSMQRPEDLIGVGSSLAQGGRVSEGSSSSQSHSHSVSDSASQSVKSGEALRVGPQDGRDIDWSAEQKSVSMQRPEDLIGGGPATVQGSRISEGVSNSHSVSESLSAGASNLSQGWATVSNELAQDTSFKKIPVSELLKEELSSKDASPSMMNTANRIADSLKQDVGSLGGDNYLVFHDGGPVAAAIVPKEGLSSLGPNDIAIEGSRVDLMLSGIDNSMIQVKESAPNLTANMTTLDVQQALSPSTVDRLSVEGAPVQLLETLKDMASNAQEQVAGYSDKSLSETFALEQLDKNWGANEMDASQTIDAAAQDLGKVRMVAQSFEQSNEQQEQEQSVGQENIQQAEMEMGGGD